MPQILTNLNPPKFDRVTWLAEILAILDEAQGIRERLDELNKRVQRCSHVLSLGPAIKNLLSVEKILGDAVDNDLAETAKNLSKISTDNLKKVVDNQIQK